MSGYGWQPVLRRGAPPAHGVGGCPAARRQRGPMATGRKGPRVHGGAGLDSGPCRPAAGGPHPARATPGRSHRNNGARDQLDDIGDPPRRGGRREGGTRAAGSPGRGHHRRRSEAPSRSAQGCGSGWAAGGRGVSIPSTRGRVARDRRVGRRKGLRAGPSLGARRSLGSRPLLVSPSPGDRRRGPAQQVQGGSGQGTVHPCSAGKLGAHQGPTGGGVAAGSRWSHGRVQCTGEQAPRSIAGSEDSPTSRPTPCDCLANNVWRTGDCRTRPRAGRVPPSRSTLAWGITTNDSRA